MRASSAGDTSCSRPWGTPAEPASSAPASLHARKSQQLAPLHQLTLREGYAPHGLEPRAGSEWGCGRQRRQADGEPSGLLLLAGLGRGNEALQQQASKAQEGLLPAKRPCAVS